MRFPWTKQEPFLDEKPKRPKETLSQVAEKILVRQMKKDPDGYGLEAAEKIKGMKGKESGDPFQQYKEIKSMLKDLMEETGGGGSMIKEIVTAITQATMPYLAQIMQQRQIKVESPQPELALPEQPRLSEPQQLPQPEPLVLGELIEFVDMPPSEVIQELKNRGNERWLTFLKEHSYQELFNMIQPLIDHPEYGAIIRELLKEKQDWLKEIVTEAHKLP